MSHPFAPRKEKTRYGIGGNSNIIRNVPPENCGISMISNLTSSIFFQMGGVVQPPSSSCLGALEPPMFVFSGGIHEF